MQDGLNPRNRKPTHFSVSVKYCWQVFLYIFYVLFMPELLLKAGIRDSLEKKWPANITKY